MISTRLLRNLLDHRGARLLRNLLDHRGARLLRNLLDHRGSQLLRTLLDHRRGAAAAVAAVLLLPLTACGAREDDGGLGADEDSQTLTVLAAASLTETFTELGKRFEAEHPGVDVKLAFDSSATLAQQAVQGAPADVLATADTETMDSARDALAEAPQTFATNSMVLAVPAANPAHITGIDDLEDPGTTWVTCVETAPCGKVAQALLADNGITAQPASLEVDVKSVLTKVTSDEADAGFVYATDAVAAGDAVHRIDVPHADEEVTTYPVAPLQQASDVDLAEQFVDLVLSDAGQRVLARAGFDQP